MHPGKLEQRRLSPLREGISDSLTHSGHRGIPSPLSVQGSRCGHRRGRGRVLDLVPVCYNAPGPEVVVRRAVTM